MRLLIGPATTPLTTLMAQHLGLQAMSYADTAPHHAAQAVFLLPYRETPDAQDLVHQALRAVDRWGPRPAMLLSNAGVFDPRNPGVRRESDAADAADTFGQSLAAVETAFVRRGANRPIVRLPAPIAHVPEAGALLALKAGQPVRSGTYQGFDPTTLAALLEPCAQIHLTHLACGPVPDEAIADALGNVLQDTPHLWDTGWDRLRTQWSEQWGRPDGLVSARRNTLPALLALASRTTTA